MATTPSRSPTKDDYFKLPVPPPQLHVRQGNQQYGGPLTPTHNMFTSPSATPQGSPSKKQLPPGANDLPDIFENALRLVPTVGNPSKATTQRTNLPSPTSPTKSRLPLAEDKGNDLRASVIGGKLPAVPGSPLAKNGKENTPTQGRPAFESPFTTQAAASRQELYKPREQISARPVQHALSADVLEKLSKPSVKRLANVTQLCK